MKELFISVGFAFVFSLLTFIFRNSDNNKQKSRRATATITNLSDHDGRVNYYVTIDEGGNILNGKSISYPSSGKSYEVGNVVPVTYYHTQNEWVRVTIQDEELVPSKKSAQILPKVLLGISIAFYIATIYFGVRLFI